MRKLLFALLLFALPAFGQQSYVEHTVVASAARTATGSGAEYDLDPRNFNYQQFEGRIAIDVTAVSGTGPTLTFRLQCKLPSGNWADVYTSGSLSAVGRTTAIVQEPCRTVRGDWTIGGTGPSFTFAVYFFMR